MNFVLNLILLSFVLLKNVIYSDFIPSLAYFQKLPVMYLTNNGWVMYENTTNIMDYEDDAVKFCQIIYPDYNITNAMQSFQTELITNWCKKNENCSKNDKHEIHPIRCINSTYKIQQSIPKKCSENTDTSLRCLSFSEWQPRAHEICRRNGERLFHFQMIYPNVDCAKTVMKFNTIEAICCGKDGDSKYRSDLDNYGMENGTLKEHARFVEIKKVFWRNYTSTLESWRLILKFRMKKIYLENNSKYDINQSLNNLRMTSKANYSNINDVFREKFLQINTIHIERILNRYEVFCVKLEQNNSVPNNCVTHLNMTINHVKKHYNHTLQRNLIFMRGYNKLLIRSLNRLKTNHSALFLHDKTLLDNLRNTIAYLEFNRPVLSSDEAFKYEFDKLEREADKLVHPERQSHTSPMMSVVVTSVILLTLIVLTFLATVIIKYCGQPFRRSPPNYIMSVVFNTNQAPLVSRRAEQQGPNVPKKADVKLNLYENPIFNNKSSMKPLEKQSLIENIES